MRSGRTARMPCVIRYAEPLFRPPSEAESLILQATLGCSYNECTFCGMYRDKRFRVRPLEELRDEIVGLCQERTYLRGETVFENGQILAAPGTGRLLPMQS